MLERFRVARYDFTIEAFEELRLPPHKGSTLRGGFGYALRKLACLYPERRRCVGCDHHDDCAYGYIFETAPPQGAQVLSNLQAIPLPFVIEPSRDQRRVIPPGDHLQFGLTLVGQAISCLPYFVLAFKELGRMGLGAGRGKYVLQRALAQHPWSDQEQILFDGVDVRVCDDRCSVTYQEACGRAESLSTDRLTLSFLTPTRLKHQKRWMREGPPFHVLVRRLLDRISSLSYFHCGQRWETDFRDWVDRAQSVQLASTSTEWVDWERFSTRQQQKVRLSGLVGQATYEGDLGPFLPLLVLGELVHVGKGTVFGNGQYQVTSG